MYKISRIAAYLSLLVLLVILFLFYLEKLDLNNIFLLIRMFLLSMGICLFHATRKIPKEHWCLSVFKLPFHLLILPSTIIGMFIFNNESLSGNYWIYINTIIVSSAGIALISLLNNEKNSPLLSFIFTIISLTLTFIIVLNMLGKFNNAGIIFWGIALNVVASIAAVLLTARKR